MKIERGYRRASRRVREITHPCYIATEVYNDVNHPNLDILRTYRDTELSRSKLGNIFTDWYYGGNGQRLAKLIGKTELGKKLVKTGLDIFATCIRVNSQEK